MSISPEEAQALRHCLRILAPRCSAHERQTMSMNIEQRINGQSSAILSLAFEDLGFLFYPDDSLRGKDLGLKIKTAAIAGEFATIIPDKKHAFISDLAAWPACPPIPASSPLRYWLPFMPSEPIEEPGLSSDETSSVQSGIGPAVSTDDLCEGFDGVKFTRIDWRRKIAKGPPDWLKACRASKGTGGASARQPTWYAISVAIALLEGKPHGPAINLSKIDTAFKTREALKPCREAWAQHRKDNPLLG